jgi:hypothetical protein
MPFLAVMDQLQRRRPLKIQLLRVPLLLHPQPPILSSTVCYSQPMPPAILDQVKKKKKERKEKWLPLYCWH